MTQRIRYIDVLEGQPMPDVTALLIESFAKLPADDASPTPRGLRVWYLERKVVPNG